MHQDSTGRPIRVGSKVLFRSKHYTIKRFIPPPAEETGPPNHRIEFEEEELIPLAQEIQIDCFEY
jgi:hypothetical protein